MAADFTPDRARSGLHTLAAVFQSADGRRYYVRNIYSLLTYAPASALPRDPETGDAFEFAGLFDAISTDYGDIPEGALTPAQAVRLAELAAAYGEPLDTLEWLVEPRERTTMPGYCHVTINRVAFGIEPNGRAHS